MTNTAILPRITSAVRNIPDFPKPGIQFKDITPILADKELFASSVRLLRGAFIPGQVDKVVGIDARGFILGGAVALQLGAGFVPVRKQGKLPHETHEASYDLEYGTATVAIHTDAIAQGERILLVDDLLATGGTAAAAVTLLERLGAKILGIHFLIELAFLGGRSRLGNHPIHSLIIY